MHVDFEESLDSSILRHAVTVIDSAGEAAAGDVVIGRNETEWKLRPHESWRAGVYRLVVDANLEDLAGNSLGRAFEEKISGAEPKSADREMYERT